MLVEGKRHVAPSPLRIFIPAWRIIELREIAHERERRRGYSKSASVWRHGVIDNPTFIGLVGEEALARWLSKELGKEILVNVNDAPRGDGGYDLMVYGVRLQVKTGTGEPVLRLRRENEKGQILLFNWDACISVTYQKKKDPLIAILNGYIDRRKLSSLSRFVPSMRGPWTNTELANDYLDRMSKLIDQIQNYRDRRSLIS